MSNVITDSFNITVNGVTKNSLADYGWALENRFDCIGQPVKQSSVVSVPFGKTYDLANALNGGEPYFVSRPITLKLGIKKDNENWRDYISDLRNTYEGRAVTLQFDGDTWTWSGTAYIQNVESTRQDCRFDLFIDADAYKRGLYTRTLDSAIVTFPMLDGLSAVEVKTGANANGTLSWESGGAATAFPITSNMPWTLVSGLTAGESINIIYSGHGTFDYRYKARSL